MDSETILSAVDSIRCLVLFGSNGWLAHVAKSAVLWMGDTVGVSLTKPNNVFDRRIFSCSSVSGTKITVTVHNGVFLVYSSC